MEHSRQFTRPLILPIIEYLTVFTEILLTRVEHDPARAAYMLTALSNLELIFPDLGAEGIPQSIIPAK